MYRRRQPVPAYDNPDRFNFLNQRGYYRVRQGHLGNGIAPTPRSTLDSGLDGGIEGQERVLTVRRLFCAALLALQVGGGVLALDTRSTVFDSAGRRSALEQLGIDPASRPDPLETTDEMRETALRIGGQGSPTDRLRRLQRFLFDEAEFRFDYEAEATLTAAESFQVRRGNCVSFTALFIALGRALDLPVRPASVKLTSEAEARSDLWVVSTHVVAVYRSGPSVAVYDFDRRREGPPVGLTLSDDLWFNAVFLNNRGVEEMVAGRSATAVDLIGDAVRLDPGFAAAWGNLGVARRRAGDVPGAFDAYLLALQLAPGNHVIRGNVAALYGALALAQGGDDSDAGGPTAELMRQGTEAMARRDVSSALKAYRQAARLAPDQAGPLVAIARARLYQGKTGTATRKLEQALALDPTDEAALSLRESIRLAGLD